MDDRRALLDTIAKLTALVEQLQARIAELEAENERLRKEQHRFRPKPGRKSTEGQTGVDRRTKGQRKHPGFFRDPPPITKETIIHDVRVELCPHCGGRNLSPTGHIDEHIVEEIPEPKIEVHCFRRYQYQCQGCQQTCYGTGNREIPGSLIGPRARFLQCFARGHLGTSLGKTNELLWQFFGLSLSRAGGLGHLKWGSKLFAPVVEKLLQLLRQAPVVHGDETGWRINGKNVWVWCFSNPKIAVFLIKERRNAAVLQEALGARFQGILVSDFYAAYNCLPCKKQRCLVHLLRELHRLEETLPAFYVTKHIRPLIAFFQEAMHLAGQRHTRSPRAFATAAKDLRTRFWVQHIWHQSTHPDCIRIYNRLKTYKNELFTFLDHADVSPDNNAAERDIRSVAAARNDGGVNRTSRGAEAFARIKSVIRTCQKNGQRFADYGFALLDATLAKKPVPLPLNSS